MHTFLYMSMLLTASAIYLPLQQRARPNPDPCMEQVAENMAVFNDGITADGTAGIGAEFESSEFYFTSLHCSLADTNAAKKKNIAKRKGTNWELTADTGFGPGQVDAEYILDGRIIKVGSVDGAKTGKAISDDLNAWKPWKGDDPTVDIDQSNCNPWTISGPTKDTDPATLEWSPQVTTPMPLEAVYYLMKEQQTSPDLGQGNILDGYNFRYEEALIVVTKDWFQSNTNGIDMSKVTDDVLGFCSLVLGYAKSASNQLGNEQSPKQFLTFMPRTEFNTVFQQVKSKIPGDLFALFNNLACYKRDEEKKVVVVDTDYCKGPLSKPVPNNKFGALSYKNNVASMNIKDWIQGIGNGDPSPDLLSKFDQSIDGSIGGLGDKTEKMFNSQRSVPLFEFRDLDNILTSKFEQFMTDVDSAVQKLHKDFADAPKKLKLKRDAPASCTLSTAPGPTSLNNPPVVNPLVNPVVNPVDPPSQPSCVPTPTDSVKDAHEGEMQKVAKFFCDKYAFNTNAKAPINIAQTVMAGTHTVGTGRSEVTLDVAFDYPSSEGNQDDVYDIKLTSVDNCTPSNGFNLKSPVANNECADILHDAWKNCGNQGRGGDITAGCLVYSIHTKY